MTYKLTATVTHRTFDQPIVHTFYYKGDDLPAILAQIDTQEQHLENLEKHGRTRFKDTKGVKHEWKLEHMKNLN